MVVVFAALVRLVGAQAKQALGEVEKATERTWWLLHGVEGEGKE